MTTMELAAGQVARWERAYVRSGYVEPITEDTATDADYLATRLRSALEKAERIARDPQFENYDGAQGTVLRMEIERLADELTPFRRAGTDLLGSLRRRFPAVIWERNGSGICGYGSPWALVAPAGPAARQLRLRPASLPGHWTGVIEGHSVTLRESHDPGRLRRALGDEIADFLIAAGPDLTPIPWSVRPSGLGLAGQAPELAAVDQPTLAGQWAAALGLTQVTDLSGGLSEYHGATEVGPVRVVWVHDQAKWDAAVADMVAEGGGQR
ncbi:hypothetical protein [Nocardia neocaledoniensis]|uniref:hypothetical protein n=1 Tax=Nocardia neocaledoniensis TaxID=236511 RepID=UPI002454FFC4|nr:hypothetical protein [Nocardia neocaledoniensis]